MVRILQVVNDMHRAGLETMLMNYYRNVDRTIIQFDFLTHRPEKSDYDDEIESMGGKMYYAPRLYPQNYLGYFKYMEKFWAHHPEYRIVHSHIDSMSYLPLLTAKNANIPIRIAHSHNTSMDKDFKYPLKQYFRYKLDSVANYYCACGQDAGRYLFHNKPFEYIPNAIMIDKFLFDVNIRNEMRKKLDVKNNFVIGHVGRITYQKNHKFLIRVFKSLSEMDQSAILMLIGVGEKENEIKKMIQSFGLEKKVKFLGKREDVNEIYQAMDVFVMPSLYEGIPVVGIEAQFSGLPCVFSDKIPQEVSFTKNTIFMSLTDVPNIWGKQILKYKNVERTREDLGKSIFNIKNSAPMLQEFYINLGKSYSKI